MVLSLLRSIDIKVNIKDNEYMQKQIKYWLINFIGGSLVVIGAIFILLPGPAFLFLPIGLAILSLEHVWSKVWLRRCQRWMRSGAVKFDALMTKLFKRKKR